SRRRHTRSDRDWSSDVCSSDLGVLLVEDVEVRRRRDLPALFVLAPVANLRNRGGHLRRLRTHFQLLQQLLPLRHQLGRRQLNRRSEERRVGKECGYGWVASQKE